MFFSQQSETYPQNTRDRLRPAHNKEKHTDDGNKRKQHKHAIEPIAKNEQTSLATGLFVLNWNAIGHS